MKSEVELKSRTFYLAGLFFLVVASWYRLGHFGQLIVLDDEWHALHALMRLDYGELFATFGHADHSIPIALWLKWMAEQFGLTEWRMGLPFLLAGVASVVILPWSLRHWLKRDEQLALAFFLAFSSSLIYYSQQARPYALLALLMPIAIIALWRYRQNGDRRLVLTFVGCAVFSAWLHPLMLAWLGWALVIAAAFSIIDARKGNGWSGLIRMVGAGAAMMILTSLLLIWPVMNDFASLKVKTGTNAVQWSTFWIAWQLFISNGNHWIAGIALALTGWGGVILARRDAAFLAYWLLLSLGAVGMIAATNAAWLHHGLVLARYSVPLQIFLLSLLALGLTGVLQSLLSPRWKQVLMPAVLVLFVVSGPLLEIRKQPNAWAKHLYYQFDYRAERNLFRLHLDQARIPKVYADINIAEGPGRVLEAGWWFESHFNPLVRHQARHQREMKIVMLSGSCMDWTHGEFPYEPAADGHQRFRMNNFLHLVDIQQHIEPGDFLVFQKQLLLPDVRPRPDQTECINQAEAMFGTPWFEDEDSIVFRSK